VLFLLDHPSLDVTALVHCGRITDLGVAGGTYGAAVGVPIEWWSKGIVSYIHLCNCYPAGPQGWRIFGEEGCSRAPRRLGGNKMREVMAACREWVDATLRYVSPNVIVAFGANCARALGFQEPIETLYQRSAQETLCTRDADVSPVLDVPGDTPIMFFPQVTGQGAAKAKENVRSLIKQWRNTLQRFVSFALDMDRLNGFKSKVGSLGGDAKKRLYGSVVGPWLNRILRERRNGGTAI